MHAPREHAAPERTGILVVRVWLEQDAPGRVRARLTQAAGLGEPATTLARLAGPLNRVAQLVMTRRYLRAMDQR